MIFSIVIKKEEERGELQNSPSSPFLPPFPSLSLSSALVPGCCLSDHPLDFNGYPLLSPLLPTSTPSPLPLPPSSSSRDVQLLLPPREPSPPPPPSVKTLLVQEPLAQEPLPILYPPLDLLSPGKHSLPLRPLLLPPLRSTLSPNLVPPSRRLATRQTPNQR